MPLPIIQQDPNQESHSAWTRLVSDAAKAYDYFTDDELEVAAAEYRGEKPITELTIPMSFQQWVVKFMPLKNHFDLHADHDGILFEAKGKQGDYVRTLFGKYVWSYIVRDDGSAVIINGFPEDEPYGYIVTELAFETKERHEIVVYASGFDAELNVDQEIICENRNIEIAEEMGIAAFEQSLKQ